MTHAKVCPHCNTAFTTKSRDQYNCSPKCGALARRRRIVSRCPCGNAIESIPSRIQHFCSHDCHVKYWHVYREAVEIRHKARRKPTPEQRAALMREYVLDMRAAGGKLA